MRRVNLTALVVFIGFLVWVFTFDNETTRAIQSKALSAFAPLHRAGTGIEDKVVSVTTSKDPEELAEQNLHLEREVRQLRIKEKEASQLRAENNRFRSLLQFEQSSPLKLIPARVIRRSASTWWRTAVIDRGYRQNVAVDSPVVTDQGLVGKTALVNANESTIILLTDEKCQVGARIQGSPERGILMGTRGSTKVTPDLRLRFLSKGALPETGAKVYSSNDGGLFPAGILLGEVRSFEVRDLFGEAFVRPAVEFSELKYVFVIEREDAAGEVAGEEGGGI